MSSASAASPCFLYNLCRHSALLGGMIGGSFLWPRLSQFHKSSQVLEEAVVVPENCVKLPFSRRTTLINDVFLFCL